MCDPLTAASAGASAVGSALSAKDANDNQNRMIAARNAATQAELGRQTAYGDRSRAVFDKSLGVYDNQPGNIATAQGGVQGTLDSNAPTQAQVGTITTANAPKVVGASETSKLGDVFSRAATNRQNLGALKGYDQNFFDNGLALKQGGRDIDTIGDFSKVSAGVAKTEQDVATRNAARPPGLLGQLFQTAGALGMAGAGRGYGGTLPSVNVSGSALDPLKGAWG